ncbi:MAG: twin-arginine translocase subunit TatC [Halolamina sp.]
MSEDPERDVDDEESSGSPGSGSDSAADEAAEESPDGSSPDDQSPDEESGFSRNEAGRAGDETDAPDDPPTDNSEAADESGSEERVDGAGSATDEGSGDDAGNATDEESAGGTGDTADEESADEESTDDAAEEDETYVEEFIVPGMESEPEPEEQEEFETPDVELFDEDETEEEEFDESELPGEAPPTMPVSDDDTQQPVDEGVFGGGPESDEEMPLAAHIEEMMRRLSVVFLVAGAVALTLLGLGQAVEALPTAVELIDALWNNAIPGAPELDDRRPRLYGPLELILTKLKVTALAGLLIGLPVFVYETYLFMRPGLYRNERRYYLAAVPTSLVLGSIGMAFAHYIIIPAIMDYFTVYTQENVASVAYGLAETFNLILVLMGYMAVVFQIPLFIMLAIMMGLTTRTWLEDKRLLFWGGFLTVAFIINPDPTGMTPFIIAATMIVLYEGTLALLRWTGN